jgi:hypothetical protein
MEGRGAHGEVSSFPPPKSTSEPTSAATICSSVDSRASADPLPSPVREPPEQPAMDSCTRRGFGDPLPGRARGLGQHCRQREGSPAYSQYVNHGTGGAEIWIVIDYLTMKMTSNGKILNYKVVDLVESYNFHIKFISIQVQTKKNTNF